MDSGKNLYGAHRQWRDRSRDERYKTPQELYDVVSARFETSWEQRVHLNNLKLFAGEGDSFGLYGGDKIYVPTNFALRQLGDLLGVRGEAMHNVLKYPAPLAKDIFTHHTQNAPRQEMQVLYAYDENGGSTEGIVRGFNTTSYERLWDWKLVKFIMEDVLSQDGWVVPPAVTDDKYPSGLYASDHDVFLFLVNEKYRINDGSDKGLARGFFAWNNEVGGNGWGGSPRSIGFTAMDYSFVCGNHIIWDVENVLNVRLSHIGADLDFRFKRDIREKLLTYLNRPTHVEEMAIAAAKELVLGSSKEDIIKRLTGLKKYAWTKTEVEEVWNYGEKTAVQVDTLWNFVNAATALSHNAVARGPFADRRTTFDAKAGQLMKLVTE